MLKRLRVQGFKSLADIEVEFPALTVLFGQTPPVNQISWMPSFSLAYCHGTNAG